MKLNNLLVKVYCILPKKSQKTIKKCHRFIGEPYRGFVAQIRFKSFKSSLKKKKIDNINRFEYKVYSQNGEDGIIQAIFCKIGTTNRFCIEFGVEDGRECNTRYLIEKQGWSYLHMDGSSNLPPTVKKEYITAENINSLFKKYKVPKEFDLLSIDLDYNTYWVWKAIKGYIPRVIIIEYNAFIPIDKSKAVKYKPGVMWDGTQYFGASLLAMVKLGKSQGYTLVGCDKNGVNAFFVKNDLAKKHFVIRDIEKLYRPFRFIKVINGKYIETKPSNKRFVSV